MSNREKVIGLLQETAEYFRECRSNASFASKAENHFWELQNAANETVELLKEQEPIAPGLEQDVDGIYSTCGKCKTKIWKLFGVEFDINPDAMPKFCPNCGREVKWK